MTEILGNDLAVILETQGTWIKVVAVTVKTRTQSEHSLKVKSVVFVSELDRM